MLFYAHSGLRYLVLLAGVLVLGYAGYGQATKREYDKTMRFLAAVFTGAIDLTALFGVAYLLRGVSFSPQPGGPTPPTLPAPPLLAGSKRRVSSPGPPPPALSELPPPAAPADPLAVPVCHALTRGADALVAAAAAPSPAGSRPRSRR